MKVRQIINIVVGLFRETEVKPILKVITKVNRLFNVYSSPSEARSAELSEFTIPSREKRAQYVDPSELQSRSAYLYLKISRALKRSYALSGSAVMRSTTGTSSLSALDPLSGQEKWRRLAGGRFGFIALYL